MADNQVVVLEADQDDAKQLKSFLHMNFNKRSNFLERPGKYNLRFVPDKSQMRAGSTGNLNRINTFRKHSAVIQSLSLSKSTDIKRLDSARRINHVTCTLRDIILDLTFPLVPKQDEEGRPLFHTVDYPSSGPDKGQGVVYFMAYHDHADVAEQMVAILPAYINQFVDAEATKEWFQPGALQALNDVQFSYDDDGNWLGTWTTADDDIHLDIMEEDMGINMDFEGLTVLEKECVLLTTSDASVYSFGEALREKLPQDPQQSGSVTRAGQATTTLAGSGGAAE
jgi:hypothetical protein